MCHASPHQTQCRNAVCSKPIYVDPRGIRHPYCSRTCANHAETVERTHRIANPFSMTGYTIYPGLQALPKCKIYGCRFPIFVEMNGRQHEYCSKSCARKDSTQQQPAYVRPHVGLFDTVRTAPTPQSVPPQQRDAPSFMVNSGNVSTVRNSPVDYNPPPYAFSPPNIASLSLNELPVDSDAPQIIDNDSRSPSPSSNLDEYVLVDDNL